MTNPQSPPPEATATPGEGGGLTASASAVDAGPVHAGSVDESPVVEGDTDALDRNTFTALVEPRSPSRLELDGGDWHQISPKYVWVQLISSGVLIVLVAAAMLFLTLFLNQTWAYIPGGIILAISIWTTAILPRQARSIGYRLRQDDLVFRRGILWQRLVAVPYGRMQLIDITHGPLDRGFGIAQLKFVTAAAATGVTIPGLEQETAEHLRDLLVEVAESRRTGL
jgi:membrane protein YdbS with pleckstrin-like domain